MTGQEKNLSMLCLARLLLSPWLMSHISLYDSAKGSLVSLSSITWYCQGILLRVCMYFGLRQFFVGPVTPSVMYMKSVCLKFPVAMDQLGLESCRRTAYRCFRLYY